MKKTNFFLYAFYFLVFVILLTWIFMNLKKESIESFDNEQRLASSKKPIIWMYWETLPGKVKPGYIDLCSESVYHNCKDCFDVIVCNEKSILDYLPEVKEMDFSNLNLPQKVDYYRYALLEKYGGVWLDADIIVMRCICPYYKKLENYDYVGFGCGFSKSECKKKMNGYGKPLNWFMISNPKTNYIKCIKDKAKEKLEKGNQINYHGIGKDLLQECHDNLRRKEDWVYYHVPSKCQEYDTKGNKLNDIMKSFEWEDCKNERIFFPLYNTAPGYPDWFKDLTSNDLKTDKTLSIAPIIEEAFKNKSCQKETSYSDEMIM